MTAKRFFVLLFFSLSCSFSIAQPTGHGRSGSGGMQAAFKGEIYGKILDSISSKPIEYATVALYQLPDSNLISGLITPANGSFSLTDLKPGKYRLRLSFIGYEDKFFENLVISKESTTINLKDVMLAPEVMESVVIEGDDPLVKYEIDKKVINVDDQNTNLGQTAIEILANAPSITVDGDGNISLRGSSSFTLLINGIPTAMDANDALRAIPAGTIENIEIITNPSAKYDAEGTSGIINIVTKKKKLEGVSLMANLNAGTFENYGGDLAMSFGKDKITFNVTANYNSRNRPRLIEEDRLTSYDSTMSRIYNEGESSWQHYNGGINGELVYEPNNSHSLVLAGSYTKMKMLPYEYLDFFEYSDGVLLSEYRNVQEDTIDLYGASISLFYQYKIKRDPNHHITIKAINNQKDVDQFDYASFFDLNGNMTGGTKYTEFGPADFNRFNLDYVRPHKNGKFETGVQVQLGYSADDGKNFDYVDSLQTYVLNPQFSSFVEYSRDVYAGYGIYSGKKKSLSYQFGLRGEYTYRTVEAENFGEFDAIKRMDWFPSVHISLNRPSKTQFLLSYSRRIQRPRSWFFEPFITWESTYNVRSGNPNLTPEYINSFEFSWIRPLKQRKGFVTLESYFRSTQNMIMRVSSVYQDNVLISQPYNVGTSSSIGLEPSLVYNVSKIWKLNAAANIFYYAVEGEINDINFDNTSFNYNVRVTNTWTLKDVWNLQLVGRYESPTATAQGEQEGFTVVDASVRRSFSDGKYSLTLQGRNVLNSQKRINTLVTENVQIYSSRIPVYPMVALTFSMKVNNYKRVMSRHEAADDF